MVPKLIVLALALGGGWVVPLMLGKDYVITPWGTLAGVRLALVLTAMMYLPATAGAAWVLSSGPKLTFQLREDPRFMQRGDALEPTRWFRIQVTNHDELADATNCQMSVSKTNPHWDALHLGTLAITDFEVDRSHIDIRAKSTVSFDIGWCFPREQVLALALHHPPNIVVGETPTELELTFAAKGMRARMGTYIFSWVDAHLVVDDTRGFESKKTSTASDKSLTHGEVH